MTKFRNLKIGDTFDFISPNRTLNSFYDRCRKLSARVYSSLDTGYTHRVGSGDCQVYHVNGSKD